MKIWKKDTDSLGEIHRFTVGNDRGLDMQLAPYDVLGSLAHVHMLEKTGLLGAEDYEVLKKELIAIYKSTQAGDFRLDEDVEDVHSQVEQLLTNKLGDAGKKIHAARSRNDQVLVDMKMFLRKKTQEITEDVYALFTLLQEKSEEFRDDLLPGYTHLQIAMPSSFGLWFGAYAESLVDDMTTLHAAWEVINKNPLGSAAGYGSSFPINRTLTTQLLGFKNLNYNVVYAQMTRGKTEKILAQAMSNLAATIGRMSMDACLYMNQNFGFIHFPDELTTGSSIMPHKKNPDVFELIRAHSNRLQSLPNEIGLVLANLPSGYHRDLQLVKEILLPAIQTLRDCLEMMVLMFSRVQVRRDILEDEKYLYLFTVEEMNKLVNEGIPLRDAYRQIGGQVEAGTFTSARTVNHIHEGSIGNLQNQKIKEMMDEVLKRFEFDRVNAALHQLLQ